MAAHPTQDGKEHASEVVQGWRPADVRPSGEPKPHRLAGGKGHRETRLQDQRDAPRRPDIEGMATASDGARPEHDLLRSDLEAFHVGTAESRDGLEGGHVLRGESGIRASGADFRNGHGNAAEGG